MNKRMKIKKGIWHKDCDCRCNNFIKILRGNGIAVLNCKGCNILKNNGIEKPKNIIMNWLDQDEEQIGYTYREEYLKEKYKKEIVNPIVESMKNFNYKKIIKSMYVPGINVGDIDIKFIKEQIDAKGFKIIEFNFYPVCPKESREYEQTNNFLFVKAHYRYRYNVFMEIERKDVIIYDYCKQKNITYLV